MRKILMLTLGVGVAFPACAEDAPTIGQLYNENEDQALYYNCVPNENKLDCDFTQTGIRRKLDPKELPTELEKARKTYQDQAAKLSKDVKFCEQIESYTNVLKGNLPVASFLETLEPSMQGQTKSAVEKAQRDLAQYPDEIGLFDRLVAFCRDKTEENFVAVNEETLRRDTKTCFVYAHDFKQTFVSVGGAWVVDAKPEGPCGLVNLSRFVKDESLKSGLTMWHYTSRRIVTNPDEVLSPGTTLEEKCDAAFDIKEHPFGWKSSPLRRDCQYISFSPL